MFYGGCAVTILLGKNCQHAVSRAIVGANLQNTFEKGNGVSASSFILDLGRSFQSRQIVRRNFQCMLIGGERSSWVTFSRERQALQHPELRTGRRVPNCRLEQLQCFIKLVTTKCCG